MIQWRRMRWVRQIARMGQMRNTYNILVGKLEGKRVDVRIILKWMLQKLDVNWIRTDWSRE
jgi:hypothetical protein